MINFGEKISKSSIKGFRNDFLEKTYSSKYWPEILETKLMIFALKRALEKLGKSGKLFSNILTKLSGFFFGK